MVKTATRKAKRTAMMKRTRQIAAAMLSVYAVRVFWEKRTAQNSRVRDTYSHPNSSAAVESSARPSVFIKQTCAAWAYRTHAALMC